MKNEIKDYPDAKFKIGEKVAYTKDAKESYPISVGSEKQDKGFEFKVARIEAAYFHEFPQMERKQYIYFPSKGSGFYEYELESRGKSFDF